MTNLQAAIGCAQMKRIRGLLAAKRKIAGMYSKRLSGIQGVSMPPEMPWARNVYWLYTIALDDSFGLSADELAGSLASDGIDTRGVFKPMSSLPMYATRKRFPVSERISVAGLSLPSSPTLTGDDIDYICEKIREAGGGG
jgi:perosamine synthetase